MGGSGKVPTSAPLTAKGRGQEPVQFLTTRELTHRLNVSERTVRRWIERGELVAHRFGAAVRSLTSISGRSSLCGETVRSTKLAPSVMTAAAVTETLTPAELADL
jgi:excisionase family DNA binding protein